MGATPGNVTNERILDAQARVPSSRPGDPDPFRSRRQGTDGRRRREEETERVAVASGRVRMAGETVELIRTGRAAKGDVLAVAQVAAVMGAKRTADLIPMCHPLMLTRIDVAFELRQEEVGSRRRWQRAAAPASKWRR